MIQSKSYGLQNETRQYLRRLYAYGRELSNTDISDIDNFIKGCKQLNLWNTSIFFLLRQQHNIGTGDTILTLGGEQNVIGTLVNSPTWGSDGITFNGVNYITTRLQKTIQTSEVSIASVCNSISPQPGFTNGYPHSVFIGGPSYLTHPYFTIVSNSTSGNTWFAGGSLASSPNINSQTIRMNGGALHGGGVENYLNGTIATTTTTIRNNLSFDRILICGRWGYDVVQCFTGSYGVGWIGTQSLVMVSLKRVDFSILQQLIKTTIGRGLGLP